MARILVVEDLKLERLLLQGLLRRAGHETVVACDGAEALEVYRTVVIDVVVTDLQMPNVDGHELIAALGVMSPPPHVIAVSGAGEDELRKARVAGVHATFGKPVDSRGLLHAIAQVMAEREGREVG